MSVVADAVAELVTVLRGVQGARVYDDPGATLDPPALVPGPPALSWTTGSTAPTSGTWMVYLVAKVEERTLESLWALLPAVVAAIDTLPDAAVIRADPGTFTTGGVELPCYEIQVDVGL